MTERLVANSAGIAHAAAILRAGGLVALPTETVYGLGADALSVRAVRGIFEAKQRPAADPLIVHVLDIDRLAEIAQLTPSLVGLAEAFWPGPLTLVLLKRPVVPNEVTAGLDTVAVRIPSHPVTRAVLEAARLPIAAPSANLFGRPSPTRAEHVLEDLDGRIDAILDGGPTDVGVESTIVDLSSSTPRLLRPGGVPAEAIEAVLGVSLLPPLPRTLAPGLSGSHYAPRAPLVLITGPADSARARLIEELNHSDNRRIGALIAEGDRSLAPDHICVQVLSDDPKTAAAQLFAALRTLDQQHVDVIFAREPADPTTGLGRALADRLRRAAQQVIAT